MDAEADPFFFPLSQKSEYDVKTYGNKMHCLKERPEIYGAYDSSTAKHLVIKFEKCNDRSTCKDDSEIREYLRDKYTILVENSFSVK